MNESPSITGEKSESTLPSALQRQLDRHFTTCTVAVGGALALVTATPAARGGIVYYDIADVTLPTNSIGGVYFDIQGGTNSPTDNGTAQANLFDFLTSSYVRVQGFAGYGGAQAVTIPYNGYAEVGKLAPNTTIGPASAFTATGDFSYQFFSSSGGALSPRLGNFAASGDGYFGFSFTSTGGTLDYGWMRINIDPTTSDLTVLDYAYEDTGAVIPAGAVPEPGSCALGCLAAGAVGLGAWRNRRKARQAAAA